MKVKGLNGTVYSLEENPISSGGEGKIHSVISDNSKLVKIYHPGTINSNLEKKISYMVLNQPSSSVFTQIAWPIDLAYDDNGKFCGFVMPRLNITNVLSDVYIYPPKYKISYKQKLILAQNICVVIHEIHKAGYVFGDFNPRNIGININNGSVAFLDTDSYHIVLDASKGKAFRCNVCAAGYAAPELLGKCYDHIAKHPGDKNNAYEKTPLDTFTMETDNFALAIHIFKLLNNGFTPFNGVKENATASVASPGTGDQAVWRDNYCFKPGNNPLAVAIPKLDTHPKYIGELFTRAFIAGRKNPASRPDAMEWYKSLGNYERELKTCAVEKTHMYSKKLHSCPWCEADVRFHNKLNPNTPITVPVSAPKAAISKLINAGSGSNSNTAASAGIGQMLHFNPLKIKEVIASVLNVAGWLGFIASIIYVCMPLVSNGSIHLDETNLYQIDINRDIIITVCALALLSIGSHFSNSPHQGLAEVLSCVWGGIFCFSAATVYYTQLGYSTANASQTWKLFGIMIVSYIAAMVGGSAIGETLSSIGNKKSSGTAKVKHKFNFYEKVVLGMMIAACVACVPLLMNLQLFYDSIRLYNLIPIAIWVAPVLFFILFNFNANARFGESTAAWFCAAMSTSFTVLVLWLGHIGGAKAIIGWIVLAILALILAGYLSEEIDSTVSGITGGLLTVVFIVGAHIDMQVIDKGVAAVGTGAHWWMIAPALITMVLAMGTTVKEISGH